MSRRAIFLAATVYVLLLVAFAAEVRALNIGRAVGGHVPSAFACFAMLLAPVWFFGFGFADLLARYRSRIFIRLAAPALLAVPYCVFAIPRGEWQWTYALTMVALPVILCALLEWPRLPQRLTWQDVLVLLMLAVLLETRLLSGAWPYPGLGSLQKIYLADVALYAYLVVRRIEGAGYSFVPQASAFAIGLREWLFFFPFAIAIGFALHFIRFIPRAHSAAHIAVGIIVTFLLTAVPEELFFRGILQNLLEPLAGRARALLIASALFGLSHFHKGAAFNWRYVIMATVAGIFYGRAWRAKRQLLASSITHTLVDVVWGLWFK